MSKVLALTIAGLLVVFASSSFAQLPCEKQSAALHAQLAESLSAEGELIAVKFSKDVKPGSKSSLVPLIRESLGLTADGGYDDELKQAVASFQEAYGLTPTGNVDATTFMNIVPLSRAYRAQVAEHAQKECALTNVKLAQDTPSRFIEVNLASQMLVAYEHDAATGESHEVLRSKVVVGAPHTETPREDFSLWALKFNPGWTPTTNILARNVVKGGKVNHKWLESHNMKVVDRAGNVVPPSEVTTSNWRQFRYSEPAGPGAALGKLKFETTSGQNIYMHDTPEKRKFDWNVRLGSSGCVRVQEIEELARWAFGATDTESKEARKFEELQASGKNTLRKLGSPIPVYFTYRLVDFDDEGNPRYFADGYSRTELRPTVQTD